MNCPYCGEKMEDGTVYARGGAGIFWLGKGSNLPLFITKRAINSAGGILLDNINNFGPAKRSCAVCRKCSKLIIDFKNE